MAGQTFPDHPFTPLWAALGVSTSTATRSERAVGQSSTCGTLELPSDLGGWRYIPFTGDMDEAGNRLVKELFEAGLPVATRDL